MPKGLSIPVFPSRAGGANIEEDPAHLETILRAALSTGGDDNPFQLMGLSEEIIFRMNDPSARALAKRSVENIIRKFSDRIALDTSVPIEFRRNEEGRLDVSFRYIDLSTNKVTDFTQSIA